MSKQAVSSKYLEFLRNIGVIAHIDAGKTTLTERILYYTDRIHRMGEVHEGTATMDFMPEEQERGITITSACTSCQWGKHTINIIDTPGHVDFTIEVERSLRVLDGAIGVFCAVGGVEPQSETVWRQSEKFKVPKLAFVNKMDRLGADFEAVLEAMRSRLKANPLPVVVPLGQGEEFYALVDLVTMERVEFDEESQGREYSRHPLTEDELAFAQPWRERLVESVADFDDDIMEQYLGGEEPSADDIRRVLRSATLKLQAVPVFAGSALKNTGVQLVLDGVIDYLPGPLDVVPPVALMAGTNQKRELEMSPVAPLGALAFKVFMDDGRKMVLMRIYSGELKVGEVYRNVTRGESERVSRLFRLHASHHEKIELAKAGDIVAAAGLKGTRTGDTIATQEVPYLLENIAGYKPVISLALEPKNSEEGDKLDEVLDRYLQEDPTLTFVQDEETGQRIISGMGELHLEVVIDRLRREYKVSPRVGNPQVVYQEAISQTAEATGQFDRELGDQHHFGKVTIRVAPRDRDKGNRVRFEMDTEGWPTQWLDAVEQGITDSLLSGVQKGYPVQDVDVSIVGMERRDGVSTPAGYHMAAVMSVKEALALAGPVLLEPIMHVEVNVPDAYVGDVISLLGMKGARVGNMFDHAGLKVVQALAPMRKLFGFSTDLRSATQGRAGLMLKFARFDMLS
ncbi:elongation factor G [Desulfovibrio mangrovi]|uniref:elongation factor G n=1 Tax=Desulfovibrio mangrovi TaxID=2976983 RepID=UPI002247367B|nr:elongation factor G [Desulfovibrio mangrovi]UZP68392.1 elongation factor G [Desulfovibrio mangrovi]